MICAFDIDCDSELQDLWDDLEMSEEKLIKEL
jgi:hypothetical protein